MTQTSSIFKYTQPVLKITFMTVLKERLHKVLFFFLSVYVKAGTQVTEITWTCKGCVIFNTSTYLRLTFPETFTQNLTKGNSILVSLIAFTHPCTVFYFHKEKTKHIPVKDGNPILWLRIQETRQGADHGVKNVT